MKNSKLFSLPNAFEWIKGLILAVGTPLLYYVQELLPSLGLDTWMKIALSAIISYFIKQFFTNSEGQMFSKEIIGNRPNDR